MEKIRILIVDDHPVVREGFRAMLSTDQTIAITDEASDGTETVAMIAEKKPNVVLMDIRMPNMDSKIPLEGVVVPRVKNYDGNIASCHGKSWWRRDIWENDKSSTYVRRGCEIQA